MSKGQVLVVDDNAEFLESAKWWLEGIGYQVEVFGDPASFLAFANAHAGEHACVLLDVRMPQMSGLQVHDRLRQLGCGWPVIYMTGHGDVPLAVEAMQKGALHFIEKPFRDGLLRQVLETAFARVTTVASLAPPAAGDVAPTPAQQEFLRRLDRLTARERQVLQMVMDGRLNKTIADVLGISIKTVELHRSRVMSKLQARSLTHLVRMVVSRECGPS